LARLGKSDLKTSNFCAVATAVGDGCTTRVRFLTTGCTSLLYRFYCSPSDAGRQGEPVRSRLRVSAVNSHYKILGPRMVHHNRRSALLGLQQEA
jgi:hypothetical protein